MDWPHRILLDTSPSCGNVGDNLWASFVTGLSNADINIAKLIGGNYPQKMSANAAHFDYVRSRRRRGLTRAVALSQMTSRSLTGQ
jgi:hypothetical protein